MAWLDVLSACGGDPAPSPSETLDAALNAIAKVPEHADIHSVLTRLAAKCRGPDEEVWGITDKWPHCVASEGGGFTILQLRKSDLAGDVDRGGWRLPSCGMFWTSVPDAVGFVEVSLDMLHKSVQIEAKHLFNVPLCKDAAQFSKVVVRDIDFSQWHCAFISFRREKVMDMIAERRIVCYGKTEWIYDDGILWPLHPPRGFKL